MMWRWRYVLLGVCLLAAAVLQAQQVANTHRVLAPLFDWEQGTWNAQMTPWLAALGADGYTVDILHQLPELNSAQLLARYDLVVMTTRSSHAGALTPQFQVALENFVRQGGGLMLLITTDQESWLHQPINLLLPTTFYLPGPGWGTALASHNVHLVPALEHPALKGIDWHNAPPLYTVCRTAAPSNELYRGTLQMLGPHEGLRKPLLNSEWTELLTADDAEHTPVAVVGSYGHGHVLVWGAGFGGDPNLAEMPAPFTQWAGFAPLWRQLRNWVATGKTLAAQPGVWVVGSDRDLLQGKTWSGQNWSYPGAVSYALPEFGLSQAETLDDVRAALLLKADPAQETALAQLLRNDGWLLACDPHALDGGLQSVSPLRAEQAPPALPPLVLGTPAPPLAPAPTPPAPPAVAPITDPALQPPLKWKVQATNSVMFQRDMSEQWFSVQYNDAAWAESTLGALSQQVGGKTVPLTGAIWYRARVTLPAQLPANAAWTFATRMQLFHPQLRVWVDGKEASLDNFTLRLPALAPGEHLVAVRLYNAGGGSYWEGSRGLYDNVGLTGITAEVRPPATQAALRWEDRWKFWAPTDVTRGKCSLLAADAPVLFRGRADGDRDFRLTFQLTAEQARQSPLLFFDEPGLIREVLVNGTRLARINQGAWDGISGGNTTAFLLRGVLREGENTVTFHPDFLRLRNLDYPVAAEVSAPCGLPRLEFSGELQALQAVDPSLAPYVPNRLFKPGATRAVSPDARVLLCWNDGRAALVQQGHVLAWTSDITAQLNAAPVQPWQASWESAGHWDFNGADNLPHGDALLWENTAPLLAATLAQRLAPETPRIVAVTRHGTARQLDMTIDNPGAAQTGQFRMRIMDWQNSLLLNASQPMQLAHGRTTWTLTIPPDAFAGHQVSDLYACYLGLRSSDSTVGWSYLEKVVELPAPVRVSIETDSLSERVLRGSIPERLAYSPDYRARHLWWPLLHEDPESTVYLDGETAHFRISVTNTTAAAQTLPLTITLTALGRRQVVKQAKQLLTLQPFERKTLALEQPLSGECEPYSLQVNEVTRPLFAVRPWKRNHNIDDVPPADGMSFNCYIPFSYIQQPDNILPTERYKINRDPHNPGPFPELLEWWKSNDVGTTGHGGGVSGYTGMTQGFAWGPFYRPATFNAPDQMSVLPNGQPVMHYVADGLRRQALPAGRCEVADFWGNYWVPLNWNTLAAFREWLAATAPEQAAGFTPQTYDEAVTMLREHYSAAWNRWQTLVAIGGWDAIRTAMPPGSCFWCQAEHAWIACQGVSSAPLEHPVDGRPLASYLSMLYTAGDTDPATSRMGWGYRFREYTENSASALVPNLHCNVSTLRHMDMTNEQRMNNMGNASAESYRAHVYDTLWASSVLPDGTLRAVVDTPASEITIYPNSTWSGLKYGNRLFERMYRLADVIEAQRAFGLLWVPPVPRGKTDVDARGLFETLRNAGVPFSAMMNDSLLAMAPKTGACGIVYLLSAAPETAELASIRQLAEAKYPVICLLPPDSTGVKDLLPAGVTVLDLPKELSPESAHMLVTKINAAAHPPLTATDGACLYGFCAHKRIFLVVQNMWDHPHTIRVTLDTKAGGVTGALTAINLNDNTPLAPVAAPNGYTLDIPLGAWDAALVECVGAQ